MSILRSIGLAAACLFVFATAQVRADASADRALIAIERPDEAFLRIRALPERVVEMADEVKARRPSADAVQALSRAATEAVDTVAMRQAIEQALASRADPPAGAGLSALVERWADTARAVEAEFGKSTEETAARTFEADFAKRTDKSIIAALAEVMARPAIYGELTVAARRIERALDFGEAGAMERLKAADAVLQVALVDALMAEGRKPAQSGGFFSGEQGRDGASAYLRARLTRLPEADVATLHAFYADPAGRAKRDALVETFSKAADAAQRRMLENYLATLRRVAR